MSRIVYVNHAEVILTSRAYPRDVANQVKLLNRQGQIVPLFARQDEAGKWRVDNSDYPYATAQVTAAAQLGWESVILTDSTV